MADKPVETAIAIRRCAIFKDVPDSEIEHLASQATVRTFRKNTIIMCAGDETDSLYIVKTGRVRVFRDNEQGRQITLNTHGPGAFFGELAALSDAPRAANVETTETTATIMIKKSAFLELLERQPKVAVKLARVFATWVQIMSKSMTDLALLDVYGRLSRALELHAVEENGERIVRGVTHQELANQVGASREMVSRIISDLKTGKYIRSEGRSIVLLHKLPAEW
jgi:CRP/FNR family transcriptional regulator, cyclic AMP receptor protein